MNKTSAAILTPPMAWKTSPIIAASGTSVCSRVTMKITEERKETTEQKPCSDCSRHEDYRGESKYLGQGTANQTEGPIEDVGNGQFSKFIAFHFTLRG